MVDTTPVEHARRPVNVLATLFLAFKLLQIAVFIGWHLAFGDGTLRPQSADARVLAAGAVLIGVGQILNASVFHRLGRVGVFYGNRFGSRVLVPPFPIHLV